MNAHPEKRKRGVLLSFQGWQRLQSAEQLAAVQSNGGNTFTLDQLSTLTGLSPNTLTKVRRRQKPVDFTTLNAYFESFELALEPTDLVTPETHVAAQPALVTQNHPPQGPLPQTSPFYVYRPPLERLCFQEVLNPGALLRIKAPAQFGKTSLAAQITGYAQEQGFHAVIVSLQLAEKQVFESTNSFLQWFCGCVAKGLNLANELETRWDQLFGASYTCTEYFESYLLAHSERPLLLIIDEFDELFGHPDIAIDFCGLLRAWYEQGRYGAAQHVWQRLRLVISHSMEVCLPLNMHQSPFNVGFAVDLPSFTLTQIREIASRYELDFSEAEAMKLQDLVGGHPYLTQLSFFHLSQGVSIEQLGATAIALDSIFIGHLRRQLLLLERDRTVLDAMTALVKTPQGITLNPINASYLKGLGLIQFKAHQVLPSCELYRQFFTAVSET